MNKGEWRDNMIGAGIHGATLEGGDRVTNFRIELYCERDASAAVGFRSSTQPACNCQ